MAIGPILRGILSLIGYSATLTVVSILTIIVLYNAVPPFRRLFDRRVLFALHAKMLRGPWADDPRFYVYYPSSTQPPATMPESVEGAIHNNNRIGVQGDVVPPVVSRSTIIERKAGGGSGGGVVLSQHSSGATPPAALREPFVTSHLDPIDAAAYFYFSSSRRSVFGKGNSTEGGEERGRVRPTVRRKGADASSSKRDSSAPALHLLPDYVTRVVGEADEVPLLIPA